MSTIVINNESDIGSSPYINIIPANSTVIINSSFTISNLLHYFVIGGSNIIIDGKFNIISILVQNYPGLVQNGLNDDIDSVYKNITIKNLTISSGGNGSLSEKSGWFCQNGFCNGFVQFCNSNGIIPENSGGIFGTQCFNCSTINCYSTGSINTYSGGIFGSYALNCQVSNSYSTGQIGQYAGGIFGFGTNYIYDGNTMIPVDIVDQDGNSINTSSSNSNNYVSSATNCTVFSSYSTGNIGSYGGGIYGYFAYKSNCNNCYSLGNGNILSGGIFAPNYYYIDPILLPSQTLCNGSNCYVIGQNLSGNGIFSYTDKNLSTTNITSHCYSEDYDSCGCSKNWINKNACKYLLYKNNKIWIIIDLCYCNIPWLLSSFMRIFYFPNYLTINNCNSYSSSSVLTSFNTEKYNIINVNNCILNPCNFKIDENNGQLFFINIKCGEYKILVIRGNKINYSSNETNYYTYTDYYFTNYYLKSQYKIKNK